MKKLYVSYELPEAVYSLLKEYGYDFNKNAEEQAKQVAKLLWNEIIKDKEDE